MALSNFEKALMVKFAETGTDGVTNNDRRTNAILVDGKEFSITLYDPANLQTDIRIQVNNSNAIDPNKVSRSVLPHQLGLQSTADNLRSTGAIGGEDDPYKESSASASTFASRWVDMPGGATISASPLGVTTAAYSGSGQWRYIRLVTSSEMQVGLEASVYSRHYSSQT